MSMAHDTAASALESVRTARAQVADAASCPPWRHAVFGAITAAYVAAPALGSPAMFYGLATLVVVIAVVFLTDRRRSGLFVNGYRRGRTRPVALTMLAVMLGLYMAGLYASLELGRAWVPLVLGLVAGPLGVWASLLWQRAFLTELAGRP